MPKRRHTQEQVVNKPRETEAAKAGGGATRRAAGV